MGQQRIEAQDGGPASRGEPSFQGRGGMVHKHCDRKSSMEAVQFDQVSKPFASTSSRRWVVRSVLAASTAFILQRCHVASAQGADCADVCSDRTGEARGACQYRCVQELPVVCLNVTGCEQKGYSWNLFTCECGPDRGNSGGPA
jgi:hypothetical protein